MQRKLEGMGVVFDWLRVQFQRLEEDFDPKSHERKLNKLILAHILENNSNCKPTGSGVSVNLISKLFNFDYENKLKFRSICLGII